MFVIRFTPTRRDFNGTTLQPYVVSDEDGCNVVYDRWREARADHAKFTAADNPAWKGTYEVVRI